MEIQLINYDNVNLTEEIIDVIEFGNVTIATQGLSPDEVYTKTETDALLLEKSNTTHNHNLADLAEKSYNSLTDKPQLFDGSHDSLSDVPSEFNPSAHNHSIADITDLQTELDSKQAVLVNQSNIKSINGTSLLGSGNIEISGGGGTSDHAQLTNRDIADQHIISSITGLETALNDKSDASHNHSLANLTEKSYNSLTDKPTLFSGSYTDLSNVPTEFNPSVHNQDISTINGLQTTLDGKADIADIPTNFNSLYYTKIEIATKIGDIETLLGAI